MKLSFWPLFTIVFFSAILSDQIIKTLAVRQDVALLNTGIALSLFNTTAVPLQIVVSVVMILGLVIFFKEIWHKNPLLSGLFFAGSVSNLIDRVRLGGVIDYLPIPILNVTNNLADWYIALAVCLIVGQELMQFYREKTRESTTAD